MNRHVFQLVGILGGFLSSTVWAIETPMAVNTNISGDTVTSAPATGMVTRSGKPETTLKINNSCFATNLRGVGNPLAPNSTLEAELVLSVKGKEFALRVEYPAELVTQAGMKTGIVKAMSPAKYSIPGGGSAGIFGNSVVLKTPIPTGVSVDASGKITGAEPGKVFIKSYSFKQHVASCAGGAVYGAYGYSSYTPTYPCGKYMGQDGPISATLGGISISSDKSVIELNVSFPGQTGFCGGYWSPLMVFFDEGRPRFDNISEFPLNPTGKTMWPEAKSPGWFVALDRDGSGKIDQKNELFGDNGSQVNGFEALRSFDSNGDQMIDKKDQQFRNLVLWQDHNGDGISQKEELVKLSQKVVKISLDYQKDSVTPLGRYAEARESAKFWYKKNGKILVGDIIDIWLSPAEMHLSQK